MPTASTSRRLAPALAKKTTRTNPNDVDDLSQKLASKLAIADPKGKQKTTARKTPEEERIEAMRIVNSNSQSLSELLQSGWKATDMKKRPSSTGNSQARAIRSSLQLLRELSSQDLDVERASLSSVGKMISLELYDCALDLLADMHQTLLSFYPHDSSDASKPIPSRTTSTRPEKFSNRGYILVLSLPSQTVEPPLLKVITTYLLYTLTTYTFSLFTTNTDQLEHFAEILKTSPTILNWIPYCHSLPKENVDSLCTRSYTALTKPSGLVDQLPPRALFDIRTYSLRCLLHASPSITQPDVFWDQSIKFGLGFVKGNKGDESSLSQTVMTSFSSLVDDAQQRDDWDSFSSCKGFFQFCEYWMGFAKRDGDIATLRRICSLMNCIPSSSSASIDVDTRKDKFFDAAKMCAIFTQVTVMLEKALSSMVPEYIDNLSDRLSESTGILAQSVPFLVSSTTEESGEYRRAGEKVNRAMERMRRISLKLLENSLSSQLLASSLRKLLNSLVNALDSAVSQTGNEDLRTSLLDTLFILARTSVNTSDPDTFMPVFEMLTRATKIASTAAEVSLPNYLRCISGAFYVVGGVLYHAARFGAAARFVQEACKTGDDALTMWHKLGNTREGEEVWTQLEEQFYKRWELLGVCYSKIADRSKACDAFVRSIEAYPFESDSFTSLLLNGVPQALFDNPKHKQIGNIIDRVTYMGLSDLFRPPSQISLLETLQRLRENSPNFGDITVGAILERQIDGIEGSSWKENVLDLVHKLLQDALLLYGDRWPIRRARILLRCLEFSYYAGPDKLGSEPENLIEETEELLNKQDFGEDGPISQFKAQYLASARLWIALHAHRSEHLQHTLLVVQHAEEACRILRSLLTASASTSPRVKRVAKASPLKTVAVKDRLVRKPKKPPVTPKQRNTLAPVSPKTIYNTPPRAELDKATTNPLLPFDQFHKLTSLLQMTAQLLGLLGHVLTKAHLLTVTRRVIDRYAESNRDEYVNISIDLAHEYVKLGRMEKASVIYSHTLSIVKNTSMSEETRVCFLLRFAESLAITGNVLQSSKLYCEAQALSERITGEDQTTSTASKIRSRVNALARAAMAANTFALIQYSKDDPTVALSALLQSLRLYNRAVDALARLRPAPATQKQPEEEDPFAEVEANPKAAEFHPKTPSWKALRNGLEWRISEGLLNILFALAQAYFARGSAREAEYFAQQAQDLAAAMNLPAMVSRALARRGEIHLYLGRLDEGYQCIVQAKDLIHGLSSEAADIRRLHGDWNLRNAKTGDAKELYEEALGKLEELQGMFLALDGVSADSRKLDIKSPRTTKAGAEKDVLLPSLLAAVLRQQIWLLKDNDPVEESKLLLNKLHALPSSATNEKTGLMAKLALHDAYSRFRADMFLSSLAESTIALPMGMTSGKTMSSIPGSQEISVVLNNAEQLFWSDLALITRRGQVPQVREAAVSLALIRAFQTSLGKSGLEGPILAVRLLDASATITLRREMLEVIQSKFPEVMANDDLQWPLVTLNGSPLPRSKRKTNAKDSHHRLAEDDALGEINFHDPSCKAYWESVAKKYHLLTLDVKALSISQADRLPRHWTVVNISITEDKSTLFISRQRNSRQPIVFCVPLKGRRESEDNERLAFDDAIKEFKDIIRLSDQATKGAVDVKKEDRQARVNWWAERTALDTRLRELLENVEFCWLGAFKTILSQPMEHMDNILASFRTRLEGVFQRSLVSLDKKQLNRVKLDDSLLECLSTLSPKCRDEELEDLIYFILDLYQFHGIPVAIAEVDIDQLTIDLRTMLEEHTTATQSQISPLADNHMFLVLDKNVEGLPWESIPALRGQSVSRIPNFDFLSDRLDLAKQQQRRETVDRVAVDPRKTFYMLNPSRDLKGTEGRFSEWLEEMKSVSWRGLTSQAPSEQQFLDALSTRDLVLYFGHGGGEQYVRSHKIRHLPRCAATMLWGCSSGSMKDMGEFDRIGTPYNYMLAGCPTLVANIWDVTDRDIDKFAQSVFDKMKMTKENIAQWDPDTDSTMSLVAAVAQSRDSCKLRYLTGAAPVVYGIPFYL